MAFQIDHDYITQDSNCYLYFICKKLWVKIFVKFDSFLTPLNKNICLFTSCSCSLSLIAFARLRFSSVTSLARSAICTWRCKEQQLNLSPQTHSLHLHNCTSCTETRRNRFPHKFSQQKQTYEETGSGATSDLKISGIRCVVFMGKCKNSLRPGQTGADWEIVVNLLRPIGTDPVR